MNVLSLFDGMSCLQIALNRSGIEYNKYYASEIDKYAIAVTQHHYPNTIQLGSVVDIQGKDLPKIDLMVGGFPCQSFSFAGKQLNFDDPRGQLFFELLRLKNEIKPKYFLFENVRMKKEIQEKISELIGVQPVEINSALVSAQNRKRLYWSNLPGDSGLFGDVIGQPEDKGILLKDILEDAICDRDKSLTISTRIAGATLKRYKEKSMHQMVICNVNPSGKGINGNVYDINAGKSPTLTTNKGEGAKIGCIQVGKADLKGHDAIKRVYSPEVKSPTLTTMGGGHREPKVAIVDDIYNNRKPRIYKEKSPTIRSERTGLKVVNNIHWRKLTPLECERLQTVPDNYTLVPWGNRMMSNSQRYKMLGNGFTVDVICHILRGILK